MKWILPDRTASDVYSTLLLNRGVTDINSFTQPSINDLYDPLLMYGIKEASEIILKAIKDKKKIFIHGDFDVDGITATTILWRFLYNDLGADALPYIPSRFDEGYGLSDDSIQAIIDQGADLIITVDCGIKDIDIVHKYSSKVDFIITDHHTVLSKDKTTTKDQLAITKEVGGKLISADALAVVHPRIGGDYPFGEICGAMVSWKLCSGINSIGNKGVDINKYLDLVSIGTVCDVMPLIDENRSAVAIGLEKVKECKNEGLRALLEVCNVEPSQIKSYHYGYVIGPRLNAAGRLEHALDAVRLLSTPSYKVAKTIANDLNELNIKRQALTKKYLDLSYDQIKKKKEQPVYFVMGEKWPEGIVGLIAGRLSQDLYRPVLVGSAINKNKIKGSARSIEEINIANILKDLDHLLDRHGGHAGAAGFTLPYSNSEQFELELIENISKQIKLEELEPSIKIDSLAKISELTFELYQQLEELEPFGNKNEEPILGIENVEIIDIRLLGSDKRHLKLQLKDDQDNSIEAIGFNIAEKYANISTVGNKISIAGKLSVNEWKGNKSLQLITSDLR